MSSVAAAPHQISSTTTLVDWQAYVGDHTGFVAAVIVLLLVPVFIFAGCCLNRVFKRLAKQRAAERVEKQADHESAPASDDERRLRSWLETACWSAAASNGSSVAAAAAGQLGLSARGRVSRRAAKAVCPVIDPRF